jgi:hypothetical protein
MLNQKKRYLWRLLVVVLFVVSAKIPSFTQGQSPNTNSRFRTRYDRFTDTTTVEVELLEQQRERMRLNVQANASFSGKELKGAARFSLALFSHRSGANRQTQPLFAAATTLVLLLDTTPLEVSLHDYRKDYFEPVNLYTESVRAEISPETLLKLQATQSLQGKWDTVEFSSVLSHMKD